MLNQELEASTSGKLGAGLPLLTSCGDIHIMRSNCDASLHEYVPQTLHCLAQLQVNSLFFSIPSYIFLPLMIIILTIKKEAHGL